MSGRTTIISQRYWNGSRLQSAGIIQDGNRFLFKGCGDLWAYDDLASARAAFDDFISDKELAA